MKTCIYRIEAPRPRRGLTTARVRGTGARAPLRWLIAGLAAAALAFGAGHARSQTATLQAATPAPSTSEYAQQSAIADRFEINSSRLALRKSQDPAIRDFAQQMVNDHQQSTDRLRQALKSGHVKAPAPGALDARHRQELRSLQRKSGEQFDQAYLQGQMQGHRNALDLQRAYAQSGDNPALKQFASQATPIVQDHLAKLEILAQQTVAARMCQVRKAPAASARLERTRRPPSRSVLTDRLG